MTKNWNAQLSSDLADKLIDKREKLSYFMITAAIAIIGFTLNNLNSSQGLLRMSHVKAPLVVACGLLLLSALASLYMIYERHRQYSRWLTLQDHGPKPATDAMMKKAERALDFATWVLTGSFIAGMAVLVSAYALAIP